MRSTVIVLVLLFFPTAVYSIDENKLYISKNVCPFECCKYGQWDVKTDLIIYKKPSIKSISVGIIKGGASVIAINGQVHVVPGIAEMTGKPHKSARHLDKSKPILILDYIGEGYSRVMQNGKTFEVKIARTKERCKKKSNWRYCWVTISKEPSSEWWVNVKSIDGLITGWVLVKDRNVKPIDSCA